MLEEEHGWLRRLGMSKLRHPATFWQRLDSLPTARGVDRTAAAAIVAAMPARNLSIRFARRVAGMGSLGRPRIVGIAHWQAGAGRARGQGARAVGLAVGGRARPTVGDPLPGDHRPRDSRPRPDGPRRRRLVGPSPRARTARASSSPICPSGHDEARLLHAMGFETANIHLGSPGAARRIGKQLAARKPRWLHDSAKIFSAEVVRDWRAWRSGPTRARAAR